MGMTRDDILRRLVTGAEYLERTDLTKSQREKAEARYDELEAELERIEQEEKALRESVPEEVQVNMDKIRSILKNAKPKKPA
jgi:hypothetical protein